MIARSLQATLDAASVHVDGTLEGILPGALAGARRGRGGPGRDHAHRGPAAPRRPDAGPRHVAGARRRPRGDHRLDRRVVPVRRRLVAEGPASARRHPAPASTSTRSRSWTGCVRTSRRSGRTPVVDGRRLRERVRAMPRGPAGRRDRIPAGMLAGAAARRARTARCRRSPRWSRSGRTRSRCRPASLVVAAASPDGTIDLRLDARLRGLGRAGADRRAAERSSVTSRRRRRMSPG